MHYFVVPLARVELWKQVLSAPLWQQLVIVFATAILTQLFAHIYLLRRRKKQKITEMAAQLMSSGREFRNNYTKFLEYNIDFSKQQTVMQESIKRSSERGYEVSKEAAFISQKTALYFLRQLAVSRKQFIEAAFLLTSIHNERFGKDKKLQEKFMKAINSIEGAKFGDFQNEEEMKKAVDKVLLPSLKIIETSAHLIIYEINRSLLEKLKQKLKG